MVSALATDEEIAERHRPNPTLSNADSDEDDIVETVEPPPPSHDGMKTAITTLNRYLESKPDMKNELSL